MKQYIVFLGYFEGYRKKHWRLEELLWFPTLFVHSGPIWGVQVGFICVIWNPEIAFHVGKKCGANARWLVPRKCRRRCLEPVLLGLSDPTQITQIPINNRILWLWYKFLNIYIYMIVYKWHAICCTNLQPLLGIITRDYFEGDLQGRHWYPQPPLDGWFFGRGNDEPGICWKSETLFFIFFFSFHLPQFH